MAEVAAITQAVGSMLAVVVAILVAWWVAKSQKSIAADQAKLDTKLTSIQLQTIQRQLFLPLWDLLTKINGVDPNNPEAKDVRHNINTLELVALCCEGRMVDEAIVKLAIRDKYIQLYEQIAEITTKIDGLDKTGPDVCAENLAAKRFYDKLIKDRNQTLAAKRPKRAN